MEAIELIRDEGSATAIDIWNSAMIGNSGQKSSFTEINVMSNMILTPKGSPRGAWASPSGPGVLSHIDRHEGDKHSWTNGVL
jgi:hypothetical protein